MPTSASTCRRATSKPFARLGLDNYHTSPSRKRPSNTSQPPRISLRQGVLHSIRIDVPPACHHRRDHAPLQSWLQEKSTDKAQEGERTPALAADLDIGGRREGEAVSLWRVESNMRTKHTRKVARPQSTMSIPSPILSQNLQVQIQPPVQVQFRIQFQLPGPGPGPVDSTLQFGPTPMRKACRQHILGDVTRGTRVPRSWVTILIQATID